MDIVYFLTKKTFYSHKELLYSLRSLAYHVSGWQRVFIIGAAPAWPHQGLEIIEAVDPFGHNKDANIIRKMLLACRHREISDRFLFVNDDHFFSQGAEAACWPNYHKGELPAGGTREYDRRLANTRRQLLERGLPIWNFDIHTPIIVDKARFLEIFRDWDWIDLDGPGVVLKSVYGNSSSEVAAAGERLADLKISRKAAGRVEHWLERLPQRPCWSVGEYISPVIWAVLARLYPQPSPFEV